MFFALNMSVQKDTGKSPNRGLDCQSKQIVYNVYDYFKKRKLDKTTYEHREDVNLLNLVSTITGISRGRVTAIVKQANVMKYEDGVVMFVPKERKKSTGRKKIVIDNFTFCIIRRKVLQLPHLNKVYAILKEENIVQFSKEILRQTLYKSGFLAQKITGVLVEDPEVLTERMQYLQAINDNVKPDKSVFYLCHTKNWDNSADNINMPSIVMVHASGPGFIKKAKLVLKIKPVTDKEESFEHFETYDWIKDVVLPQVPPASVVILDFEFDATLENNVHVKIPTEDSSITDLKDWLNHYKVSYKDNASASELTNLIKNQEAKIQYNFITLLKENGHCVLHLPKNHSDLNPVAVMWHDVKENVDQTPAYSLFTNYSTDQWEQCILHVKENEAEYYTHGLKVERQNNVTKLPQTKMLSHSSDTDDEGSMDCS